ncbi:hypothetical protein ACFVX3_32025 [Rhodococcus erythropolis]
MLRSRIEILIADARDDGYESDSLSIDFDEPTHRDTPLTGNPAEDRPAAFYDRPRAQRLGRVDHCSPNNVQVDHVIVGADQ